MGTTIATIAGASHGLAPNLAEDGVDVIGTFWGARDAADEVVDAVAARGRRTAMPRLDVCEPSTFARFVSRARRSCRMPRPGRQRGIGGTCRSPSSTRTCSTGRSPSTPRNDDADEAPAAARPRWRPHRQRVPVPEPHDPARLRPPCRVGQATRYPALEPRDRRIRVNTTAPGGAVAVLPSDRFGWATGTGSRRRAATRPDRRSRQTESGSLADARPAEPQPVADPSSTGRPT